MENENILIEGKQIEIKDESTQKELNEERVRLEEKLLNSKTKAARILRIRDCLCTIGGNDVLPF